MTWIRVDPDEVAAIGAALLAVSGELATVAQDPHASAGVAPGSAVYGPLHELLSHWELRRRRLGAAATDLADRAVQAGGAYLRVEEDNAADLGRTRAGSGSTRGVP